MSFLKKLNEQTWQVAVMCFIFLSGCTTSQPGEPVHLIPKPAKMEQGSGYFKIDKDKLLSAGLPGTGETGLISCISDEIMANESPEGYRLEVGSKGITIQAGTDAGFFYARQTLLQLLTPQGIPYMKIEDKPRFGYRGLHLDVSRHFFPKEFILKMLDVMASYKLNTFHWHLTDGAGWRIQIDSYPLLTKEAAFRDQANWQEWWNGDRRFVTEGTPDAYGGYYTKDDIREVVAYAASKHITVIPEIEMPGHSEEVLVAYPELSCSGKPYVNGDFCIGNEATFTFVEKVLEEVMELFPSEHIHIGGDEAGKSAWKTCPKCKKRMQQEQLKDVDELQSYMIRRVEKFLLSKGRKLVGWDEILEGGLAPEATVMSWRGEEGGIQAAQEGHPVIMTPSSYLYLDFYQADPKTQPLAIGGYTPIKRVYSYNPIPGALTPEEEKYILGAQANIWAEYIPDEQHMEYMAFPRLLALAEVAWTPQELRSWEDFKPRVNAHIPLLQQRGINTFTLSDEIEITMEVDTVRKEIQVMLDAEKYPAEIRYTTDGTTPTASSAIYDLPILVKDSAYIKAAIFRNGVLQGIPAEKKVDYHRGINKPIHYNSKLYKGYMAGGTNALLDGYRGGLTYLDGRWQGYTNSLDCVVDMGEVTDIHKVSARFMQLIGPCVFQPGEVELLISEDGVNFISQGVIPTTTSNKDEELSFEEYTFRGNRKARYIQLKAKEVNNNQFIFVDEIVIW